VLVIAFRSLSGYTCVTTNGKENDSMAQTKNLCAQVPLDMFAVFAVKTAGAEGGAPVAVLDTDTMRGTEYVIYERPQQPDGDSSESPAGDAAGPLFSSRPTLEVPAEDAPALENPTLENTTQLNIDKTNPLKNKILTSQSTDSFPFPSAPSPTLTVFAEPEELKRKEQKRKRQQTVSQEELVDYREFIRENIDYDGLVRDYPCDVPQLDEMVELMVEAVCSKKKNLRVAGNDFPQAAVKSRLLKLDREHIRFVFDCLRENTTQVRNMKQYLLTTLYNAPVTIESYYVARVNHDLYGGENSSAAGQSR